MRCSHQCPLRIRTGGQPSTTQAIAGPWLSPKLVTTESLPIEFPDMTTLLIAANSGRPCTQQPGRGRPRARTYKRPDSSLHPRSTSPCPSIANHRPRRDSAAAAHICQKRHGHTRARSVDSRTLPGIPNKEKPQPDTGLTVTGTASLFSRPFSNNRA